MRSVKFCKIFFHDYLCFQEDEQHFRFKVPSRLLSRMWTNNAMCVMWLHDNQIMTWLYLSTFHAANVFETYHEYYLFIIYLMNEVLRSNWPNNRTLDSLVDFEDGDDYEKKRHVLLIAVDLQLALFSRMDMQQNSINWYSNLCTV